MGFVALHLNRKGHLLKGKLDDEVGLAASHLARRYDSSVVVLVKQDP